MGGVVPTATVILHQPRSSTMPPSAPRRRLLIAHSGGDLYGSDLVCLRVARGARAADWDVEVMVPRRGALSEALSEADIPFHVLDPIVLRRSDLRGATAAFAPVRWGKQLAALRRFRLRRRFDLVHSNTSVVLGGLWLARRWRVPHVAHVHEVFWQHRAVVGGVERLLARSDAIICASTAVMEQFRLPACRYRCRVAYSGVDVPEGLVETRPLERAIPRIVCVGRLSDLKGQDVLIDAVHRLAATGRLVDLHFLGDVYASEVHHKRRLFEQVRRLGLEEVVSFEGERRDVLPFVADSDVLVLPSRRPEAFGMALVEAMAVGRPVVASAAGGPREIVTHGHDGLLVAPGSSRELAHALTRLVDHPEWARELGAQARHRARSFTVAAMVDAVLSVYSEVTGGRARETGPGGGERCI